MSSKKVIAVINEAIRTGKGRTELATQNEVANCLENISLKKSFKWGTKIDCWAVWKVIFERKDITTSKALKFAGKYMHSHVWQIVLAREGVLKFLQEAPSHKVIFYADRVNYWSVWQIVLARPDIPIKEVVILFKAFGYSDNSYNLDELWKVITQRSDYVPVE